MRNRESQAPRAKRRQTIVRLGLETLEDRRVLSGIVTIGDSWAWLVAANAPGSAPAAPGFNNSLGQVLNTFHPGTPVYNESFAGGTAAQHVAQLYTPGGVIDRINAHPDADIVWLSSGGNDMLLGVAGGGFYVNNPNNGAVYAAIQNNVQTLVNAILAVRPDIQVVIEGYDYVNIWDTVSGSAGDTIRANLGVLKSGNKIVDAVQNQAVNDGFKAAEAGKDAIANASRRVAHISNFGLNNTYGGYSGYFGNFPAAGSYPPELYPTLPTPASRMNSGDAIHLNNLGYGTLALYAEQVYLSSALATAQLGLNTTTLGFGDVRYGSSSTLVLSASNVGPSYTKVKNAQFGTAGGDFSGGGITSNPLFKDPSLGSDVAGVSYVYTPSSRGADSSSFGVTSDNGGATVALSGRGVGPQFQSAAALNFGNVSPTLGAGLPFSVSNTTPDGNLGQLTNLTLASATITGPGAGLLSLAGFTPGTVLGAGGSLPLTLNYNAAAAPGTYTANLLFQTDQGAAFGGSGQTFSVPITFTVVAPPVANAGGPYVINEGGAASLTGLASAGDITTYEWDLDNNGSFETAGATPSFSAPNSGVYPIALRVTGLGGSTTATANVTVDNLAPTAGLAGPSTALRGQAVNFTLSATDVSPADQLAGFTFTVDWGDGTAPQTVVGQSGVVVSHAFALSGPLAVSVTAADQDAGASGPALAGVNVASASLVPNVDNPSLLDLVWTGTSGVDAVQFEQIGPTSVRVLTSMQAGQSASLIETYAGVTGRVIARGGAGNDTLNAAPLATISATLDGQAGNNTLYGGDAGDVLIGGSNGAEGRQGNNTIIAGNGNNTIYGNDVVGLAGSTGGNNLIVGGSADDTIHGAYGSVRKLNGDPSDGAEGGQNLIVGGGGTDAIYASQQVDGAEGGKGSILVAGTTSLDQNALAAVLSEWTSARTLAERQANILGTGVGPRNNGDHFLQPGGTLSTDSAVDQVFSDTNGQPNWLFYDFALDQSSRAKPADTLTDIG